jgi:hypothetical protein
VSGEDYAGMKISLADLSATYGTQWANSVVKTYPKGSTVEVFYNPRNPKESLLDRSTPTWGHYAILLGAALFGIFMTVAAVWMQP